MGPADIHLYVDIMQVSVLPADSHYFIDIFAAALEAKTEITEANVGQFLELQRKHGDNKLWVLREKISRFLSSNHPSCGQECGKAHAADLLERTWSDAAVTAVLQQEINLTLAAKPPVTPKANSTSTRWFVLAILVVSVLVLVAIAVWVLQPVTLLSTFTALPLLNVIGIFLASCLLVYSQAI
jgi:hypothetical protein